jgi:hypothetical protein
MQHKVGSCCWLPVRSFTLSDDTQSTKLFVNRYLTLVIRFLVDDAGNLRQGGLVDLNQKNVGQFRQLDEVPDLIKEWLKNNAKKPGSTSD